MNEYQINQIIHSEKDYIFDGDMLDMPVVFEDQKKKIGKKPNKKIRKKSALSGLHTIGDAKEKNQMKMTGSIKKSIQNKLKAKRLKDD